MKDFAAIDFETANGKRTSVCSVGVVVVRGGEVTDTFYRLIRPRPNYYSRFTTVFDLYGMSYPGYTFYCTCRASRRIFGRRLPNHQLHTVSAACGYELENHHHALADAEACARIALKLL